MDSLNGTPAVIDFPAGAYLFTKTLRLKPNVILRGHGNDSTILLLDMAAEVDAILAQGSIIRDTVNVIANIARNDNRIMVDTIGNLQVGDDVLIVEDDDSLITSSWAIRSTGQINVVDSIDGNQVFLRSSIRRNFFTQNNIDVVKLDLAENIGIENLKVVRMDSTGSQTSNILFQYAANCWVKCIESEKSNFAHIDVRNSTNIEVRGSYIHGAFNFGGGGKAYGVMLHFNTGENLILENIFDTLRHSMIMQAGANGNVFTLNYSINAYWDDPFLPQWSAGDLVLHGNYAYANLMEANVVQNIVIDNSHDENGPLNTLFRNRGELIGIFMNSLPASDSQNIVGNEITTSGSLIGNYVIAGSGHFEYGNNQIGNIRPVGTDNLTDQSIFFDTVPGYYLNNSSWPPIGIPNPLDSFTIEAEERYHSGSFTQCIPTISVPDTTTSIINHRAAVDFSVYPNPSMGAFIVEIAEPALSGQFILYDLQGAQAFSKAVGPGVNDIQLQLAPGMYIYQIEVNGRVNSGKLCVQ